MIFNASVWFISFTYLHRTIFNLSDNLYLAIYSNLLHERKGVICFARGEKTVNYSRILLSLPQTVISGPTIGSPDNFNLLLNHKYLKELRAHVFNTSMPSQVMFSRMTVKRNPLNLLLFQRILGRSCPESF